jgi:eukaryotic-like serine/threonine-protein kinase
MTDPAKEPASGPAMTKIEPAMQDATVVDTRPPGSGDGLSALIDHYRAIVRAKAVYYPVAYRFVREIGRGRQGIVFLGLRQGARGCETRHAIKVFDPAIYPSAQSYWTDMGRIAAQTSRLQLVQSPHLVAPDVYEEFQGIGYLQMEHVHGTSLRELLDGRGLPTMKSRSTAEEWASFTDVIVRVVDSKVRIQPGVAVFIIRRLLRGLEMLHGLGFVHSDVKPANILIDRLGNPRLIDYGRATVAHEPVSFLLGTPMYMAPEMHRRQPPTVQADIYSAGLVLLEMLRGVPLCDWRITDDEQLLSIKRRLAEDLPGVLPDYVSQNQPFVELMRRFLDPDPARRFGSAREADSGRRGLSLVHKQLALAGKDAEYGRELENFIAKLVDPATGLVDAGSPVAAGQS